MTNPTVAYVDPTALVKLFVAEPESDALELELLSWPVAAVADIGVVETMRALSAMDDAADRARVKFDRDEFRRKPMNGEIRQRAAAIAPRGLGTVAAIHLATA